MGVRKKKESSSIKSPRKKKKETIKSWNPGEKGGSKKNRKVHRIFDSFFVREGLGGR